LVLVLALETASERASAALVAGDEVRAGWHGETAGDLCRQFAPRIAEVLEHGGVAFGEVELVAVGLGPGSFTSLRIGLATAKAIALSRDVPLVGVSSLAAMAWQVRDRLSGPLCPVLDAKRGDLYAAGYRMADGQMHQLQPEIAAKPEAVVAAMKEHGGPGTFLGQMTPEQAQSLEDLCQAGWKVVPDPVHPDAACIAELGRVRFESQGSDDLTSLRPLYVRMSYAEERFDIDLGLR
jgi:tRNA threonylcarbamoyladenosine biosynthesis protein TsaB